MNINDEIINNEEQEDKVFVTLKKEPLKSERKEKKQKRIKTILITLVVVLFTALGFSAGYVVKFLNEENAVYTEIEYILDNYWLYKNDYENLKQTIKDKALYGIAFDEDPYTGYMSEEEYNSFASSINMNYVGIGVRYTAIGGNARVLEVFKGSSAEEAGMRAGDIILKVEDVVVTEDIASDLKQYITGEEGTYVNVTVFRDGKEVTLNIKRRAYDTTVSAYPENDYLVLTISSFGMNTSEEIEAIFEKYPNYKKLIIDLRDDTGGYQVAVQRITGLFVGGNKVYLQEKYADGSITLEKTPNNTNTYTFDKIAILCNENSASCSEVFIGCLQDHLDNVTLIGTKTYGKGVVQSSISLSDGSIFKLTISSWFTPNGRTIHGVGFTPDYIIERDEILDSLIINFEKGNEIKYDSVSEYTRLTQMALKYLGYDVSRNDGYFDLEFVDTVKKFQTDHDLEVTGSIDYATYYAAMSDVTYVNTIDNTKDIQLQKAIEIINEK